MINKDTLQNLLNEGKGIFNFEVLLKKLQSLSTDNELKIVLLGGFSTGKTAVIAALLGEKPDDMKICSDESTSDITEYRHKNGWIFVDTPGLFGTKTQEEKGEKVKISDKTLKYISQAPVLLYICDSDISIRDSQKNILRHIFIDLKKLDSTIFVINKLDLVGSMKDDESYKSNSEIKTNAFRKNIIRILGIGDTQADKINVICIAAAPKGKDISYWQNNPDDYKSRSRIDNLKNDIQEVYTNSDIVQTIAKRDESVIVEASMEAYKFVSNAMDTYNNAKSELERQIEEQEYSFNILINNLKERKDAISNRLEEYKNTIFSTIDNLTLQDDITNFYYKNIGEDCCYIKAKLKNILEDAVIETRLATINSPHIKKPDAMISPLLKFLSNGSEIFKIGSFAKIPTKVVVKCSKILGVVGIAASIFSEIYEGYVKAKNEKELGIFKQNLQNELNRILSGITKDYILDDEQFYSTVVSNYQTMKKELEQKREQLQNCQIELEKIKAYHLKMKTIFAESNFQEAEIIQ